MSTVKSTEIQKSFGKWLDKTHEGPVAIAKYDRPAAFLISATQYQDLVENYRRPIRARDLSDRDMELILAAEVETDAPYTLDDVPEIGDEGGER
ncbi:MAG: hypothetical protein P0Y65_08080 [Candidatus Devosia phytovorans]|uniref:Antitoxin n=1 Tax=Candidatus Devosia phytovorans TaxID=3121372 RepID=A0AAJ5VXI3_9HYPH|nr:type II toxin-antitoxin system Phd/YefM family antitoxin [Devosia sp.]WEK06192.1 MAG: hypothetical protein P0Y65_08080 [Devosia sp.]